MEIVLTQIPDMDGYFATRNGRIFSNRPGSYRWKSLRELTQHTKEKGYKVVGTCYGEKRVHRLLLLTFLGACPSGMECRHLNGRPDDNRLENLRWGSPAENSRDAVRHGTHSGLSGNRHIDRDKLKTRKKVTVAQVLEIRRRYVEESASTMRSLGLEYGIANQTVSNIVNSHTWRDV